MSKRILKQYCTKNFRKIRHRKGFGVHSPFAYNLITKVIEETYSQKTPISVNMSDEMFNYFDMYALLTKNDLQKAIKTELIKNR